MMSGMARNSMLPMFWPLKPQVSAPLAPRPVENNPPKIRRMPSQALLAPRSLDVRPTTRIASAPKARPMAMDSSEASTDLVLSRWSRGSF